ncbi:MAG TPA: TonB-dependent receptor [Planctomycetota bacterium]|nr:TonB-dependent receptor [Planctomycetota bacterium]
MFPGLIAVVLLTFQDPPAPPPKPPPQEDQVVTAKRYESGIVETPAGVTVIEREDIARSNAHTVVDLLQGRAGVFITKNSSNPQDSVVEVRGFNNGGGNGQRLLVLVDGRKVNSVTGSQTDWASIPLENVERIEILRGPAAALYGDGAVAGVILIQTRRPTKEPSGSIGGSGGSFRSYRTDGSYRASEGAFGIALFAGLETAEGFRENSAFTGENATALLTYEFNPAVMGRLKLGLHDDDRERPGTLTEAEIDQFGRDGSTTLGDESTVRQGFADLGLDWDTGAGMLTPALYYTSDAADSTTTFAGGTSSADSESSLLQFTLKHVAKFTVFGFDSTLVAGLEAGLESASTESLNNFPNPPFPFVELQKSEFDRHLWGAFVRAESRITTNFLVAGAVRYDAARIEFDRETQDLVGGTSSTLEGDEDFSNTSPLGSLSWFFTDKTSMYASAGKTFRLPNRDELVGFLSTSLDLEPERATIYEIGLRSKETPVLGGGVAVYSMDVHNEIFFVPPATGEDVFATGNFGQNENVERVRHRGLELELESSPEPSVFLRGSVTFQRTTLESGPFEGKEMPITPDLAAAVEGTWTSAFGLSATLAARYVGERFLLNDLSNDADPLDDYAVVDLRLRWAWKKAVFFFEANNLFGEEYFDNGGIGAGSTGIWGAREAFNPAPEESFMAGVTVEF